MKKLDLKSAADEFEMIDDQTHLFYNTETGEFDFYSDFMDGIDADAEKFEDDVWVAAPSQRDLGEYDIMVDFAETVSEPHKNELLCVALEGRGAFRRFKDTLHRVDLTDEWYAFKHKAYVETAREWCEENEIEYVDNTAKSEPSVQREPENTIPLKLEIFIPVSHMEPLREALRSVGAGAVGNYDSTLSYSPVKGCWRPLAGANPYDGKIGVLSEADEYKVEVCCLSEKLPQTISAIKKVHPYEEPVINVIPLLSIGAGDKG